MPKVICFYITVPDEESAKMIINKLLDQKLIACGNIISADSLFVWQNSLEIITEKICILKSLNNLKSEVIKKIEELHPYDIPLIAHWSIKVNKPYYDWMESLIKC